VIGVEAVATIIASFCGGVVQTTPYIGHPAYKIMGGRSAYVLATAIFIGAAGVLGFFGFCYQWIPQAAVYPILVFIGIEITAQSFLVTPRRHYPAVALACVPALATLSVFFVGQIFADSTIRNVQVSVQTEVVSPDNVEAAGKPNESASVKQGISINDLSSSKLRNQLTTAGMIANGFLLTSLFWSAALAMAIDRRLLASAAFLIVAGGCTVIGLIHSPLPNNAMFLPFAFPGVSNSLILPRVHLPIVLQFAFAYFLTAAILGLWQLYLKSQGALVVEPETDSPDTH
jgi:adenine/guanine/hypoxanthine permease